MRTRPYKVRCQRDGGGLRVYVDVCQLRAALGGDDGARIALLVGLAVGPHVVHASEVDELFRVVVVNVEWDLLALLRDPLEVA
jgi:hypothetical protein